MVPSSVKHSNREERERKMQSSENQQVETRARNGTGLEFGSFFHRRGTDHFQLSTAFSWERSLSLGKVNISKCKHTPAASSPPLRRRWFSLVHSCVTRLHSHFSLSWRATRARMCLDMQAWDRCAPAVNIVPHYFRSARVPRLPLSPPPMASDDGNRRARKQIVIALNGLSE